MTSLFRSHGKYSVLIKLSALALFQVRATYTSIERAPNRPVNHQHRLEIYKEELAPFLTHDTRNVLMWSSAGHYNMLS